MRDLPRTLTRLRAFSMLALCLCASRSDADDNLETRRYTVDGVSRIVLAHCPPGAKKRPAPVVFVFHGQGGTALDCVRDFAIHTKWREAIVIYMQGIPRVAPNDPEGKLTGWQRQPGTLDDRDLRYFDAVCSDFRKTLKVDDERLFVVGHSDGGAFAYLLWSQRGEQLAGVVSCAMHTHRAIFETWSPKPLLQIAGKRDPIATLSQQQSMVDAVRKLNECGEGQPWRKKLCTMYPSEIDCPVVFFVHPGGHEIPKDAPSVIVEFLKNERKPKSTNERKTSSPSPRNQ